MPKDIKDSALDYHRYPTPGKLAIVATKPLANQRDLTLAYSPGVAAACEEIVKNPAEVFNLTAKSNLVAVISNGTAVLGLGNIGPLAAKPVMEGKAVLFKKFAGIDVFDIEIQEEDPEKLVDIIAALEPTFGAINLEDIKAPGCFYIEEALKKRLKIPVFHDDQHGTAIIVSAAILNGLEVVGKNIADVKIVTSGAGAAAIACLNLLVEMGARRENIIVTDVKGVVFVGRVENMDPLKSLYASTTTHRTLKDALTGADIFLGLSAGNVLDADDLAPMAKDPLILALANPTPEVDPVRAKIVRPDAIVATGRSDFPNQVNNVLCFPFIFRGALDVGATSINEAMKMAAVRAIARLAKAESSDIVEGAYGDRTSKFGPDFLIPKPFDPRLILEVAPAVAAAAMETGVATRPLADLDAYRQTLNEFVFRSGFAMKPLFNRAKGNPLRVVYSDGEDERILRAVQIIVDEGIARPVLIGRRRVLERRIEKLGLRLTEEQDFDICDPEQDDRYHSYWQMYHSLMERKGVSPDFAKTIVRTNTTVIGSLMLARGEVDAMVCGSVGRYMYHLEHVLAIVGFQDSEKVAATLNALVVDEGIFFFADTYVNECPSADVLAKITLMASEKVEDFGYKPKVALVSHANFGSNHTPSALKMRDALTKIQTLAPDLEIEGEMHSDAAIDPLVRDRIFPNSRLKGAANLLIMPSLESANISFNLAKALSNGQNIGPVLLGAAKPVHILTPSATVRGIINMTAIAVVDAQKHLKVERP